MFAERIYYRAQQKVLENRPIAVMATLIFKRTIAIFFSLYFTGILNFSLQYNYYIGHGEFDVYCCCGDDGISTCKCETDCCNHLPGSAGKTKRKLFSRTQYSNCSGPSRLDVKLLLFKFLPRIENQSRDHFRAQNFPSIAEMTLYYYSPYPLEHPPQFHSRISV